MLLGELLGSMLGQLLGLTLGTLLGTCDGLFVAAFNVGVCDGQGTTTPRSGDGGRIPIEGVVGVLLGGILGKRLGIALGNTAGGTLGLVLGWSVSTFRVGTIVGSSVVCEEFMQVGVAVVVTKGGSDGARLGK